MPGLIVTIVMAVAMVIIMVGVVVSVVMVVMARINSDNCVVVIAVMDAFIDDGTVMMVPIMPLVHAHAYAAGTHVKVLSDRRGRNCDCKAKNQSERR